jgi:anti-sigma B factor antagonist
VYQGITQLALAGEADLATAEPLREAIIRALHGEHVAAVLIDLHALSYLDSTTIGVLMEGRRLADEKRIGYRIINPGGVVRHVLRTAGVLDYLSGIFVDQPAKNRSSPDLRDRRGGGSGGWSSSYSPGVD